MQRLAEHLAAATDAERRRWQKVRFHTEAGSLCVSRGADSLEHFAEYHVAAVKPPPALVLRLPRAALGHESAFGGNAPATARRRRNSRRDSCKGESPMAVQPSLSWQEKTVTVSLHYGPTARLAQEPSVGLSQ